MSRTMDSPAVRWTSGRIGVPELSLEKETLRAPRPPVSDGLLPFHTSQRSRTPGDSKQHEFACAVVLWQEVWPLVEHPELTRLNRLIESTGLVRGGSAIAEPARAPRARVVAASIVRISKSSSGGQLRRQQGPESRCTIRSSNQVLFIRSRTEGACPSAYSSSWLRALPGKRHPSREIRPCRSSDAGPRGGGAHVYVRTSEPGGGTVRQRA